MLFDGQLIHVFKDAQKLRVSALDSAIGIGAFCIELLLVISLGIWSATEKLIPIKCI